MKKKSKNIKGILAEYHSDLKILAALKEARIDAEVVNCAKTFLDKRFLDKLFADNDSNSLRKKARSYKQALHELMRQGFSRKESLDILTNEGSAPEVVMISDEGDVPPIFEGGLSHGKGSRL
ncbi:MAG: hypothetical protein NTU61_06040 [Candidatus Altiarchaeota archaeon]|nr:hypothetical protein [Candidatus Altiarchaeota archaeon]